MAEWRTLIVEDAPAVAEVHRRLVASTPGFAVVGSATTDKPPLSNAVVRAKRALPCIVVTSLIECRSSGLSFQLIQLLAPRAFWVQHGLVRPMHRKPLLSVEPKIFFGEG